MRTTRSAVVLLVAGLAAAIVVDASRSLPVGADDDPKRVVIRDDCDPDDPGWLPTGGCVLKEGDVRVDEFDDELSSPLSLSVIGHQAWRNDPPYLTIEEGEDVRVRNRGGRVHTFTEVAEFGGGRVPPLRQGLMPAPECLPTAPTPVINLPPGARLRLTDLGVGNHRFQCCIHPWMRAIIKVKPDD